MINQVYAQMNVTQDLDDPNFGKTPAGIPIAAGVFFLGFIILGIGSMGRAMSKRR
jgi:hypothetical protein